MNRNFIEEFRNKVRVIDGEVEDVRRVRYDEAETLIEPLFSIYKRAIPFTQHPLNRMVATGMPRKEADEMTVKLIRKEAVRRVEDISQNVFFSYDIVPMDATAEEKSPFYNEGSPIL